MGPAQCTHTPWWALDIAAMSVICILSVMIMMLFNENCEKAYLLPNISTLLKCSFWILKSAEQNAKWTVLHFISYKKLRSLCMA